MDVDVAQQTSERPPRYRNCMLIRWVIYSEFTKEASKKVVRKLGEEGNIGEDWGVAKETALVHFILFRRGPIN